MSDTPQGPGWWEASDGRWYPPETFPAPDAGDQVPAPVPGYAHGPYAHGSVPPQTGTNGLAVASLVCSIVGTLCFCLLAIVGIVLGHVALSQLSKPENHQEGRGLAIAGLIVGYGGFVLSATITLVILAAG